MTNSEIFNAVFQTCVLKQIFLLLGFGNCSGAAYQYCLYYDQTLNLIPISFTELFLHMESLRSDNEVFNVNFSKN